MMEEIDQIAGRVATSALAGLFLGASIAIYRGSPIPRTSLSVAASCALTGTACFGSERVADGAIQLLIGDMNPDTRTYASHTLGGSVGGGISGGLFQGRGFSGALLFTPIMLSVAYAELSAKQYRIKRLNQLIAEETRKGGSYK